MYKSFVSDYPSDTLESSKTSSSDLSSSPLAVHLSSTAESGYHMTYESSRQTPDSDSCQSSSSNSNSKPVAVSVANLEQKDSRKSFRKGDEVDGTVIEITRDLALIDLGTDAYGHLTIPANLLTSIREKTELKALAVSEDWKSEGFILLRFSTSQTKILQLSTKTSSASKEAELLSEGSKLHAEGRCSPCLFLKDGCEKGSECKFCHIPHAQVRRARPSKARRNFCKDQLAEIAGKYKDNFDLKFQACKQVAEGNPYLLRTMASFPELQDCAAVLMTGNAAGRGSSSGQNSSAASAKLNL
eukprot:TRINITY_DN11175_c4_g1_i1.p1 TRINITY_DN11175_c4_g1~~TRINITY_DN11175_c4_g1_i1.p1  ORF type:complete len:329 (-),score=37.14 TRINITY_DN11175_c4_g1_i1:62-961(-)